MRIKLELDEKTLRQLVLEHFQRKLGDVDFRLEDVKIETKSKQNYRSEWERADFRATYEGDA